MIELGLWRASIGRFSLACVSRLLRLHTAITKPVCGSEKQVSVCDISTTWLSAVLLVWILCCGKECVVHAWDNPFVVLDILHPEFNVSPSVTDTVIPDQLPDPLTVTFTGTHSLLHALGLVCVSSLSATLVLAKRRILLSGDIEQNPGPGDSEKNNEHEAEEAMTHGNVSFKKLEESLQKKLDLIINQISSQSDILKQQEETMRRQSELLKQQSDALTRFGAEQEQMKETVTGLCSELKGVKNSVQKHERAIGDVSVKQDRLNQTIESLEAEIDRLEGFSRRNNVKFFGIPEASPGEREDCAETVTNLLQTYMPDVTWGPETIERAHRLGKFIPGRPHPRPIIAKFQSWRDAIRVMKDRDARNDMEHDGVRAAQDLTRRQVERLKSVRAEGKVGYFVNGKLHVRDDQGDSQVRDRSGSRGQRGGTRGRGGRGRGLPASQQQDNASGRGPNMSHPINDTTGGDVTSSQGHQSDVFESRPRTRALSAARQVTMQESWNQAGKRGEASNDTSATRKK